MMARLGRALAERPGWGAAHGELGRLLFDAGRPAARRAFARSLAIEPAGSLPLANFAALLVSLGDPKAAAALARALALAPQFAGLWNARGVLCRRQGRLAVAAACQRRALAIEPGDAGVLGNHANLLMELGRPAAALRALDRALLRRPGDAERQWARALALLALGRYAEGWAAHEARLRRPFYRRYDDVLAGPAWEGGPLAGRTLMVQGEQGLGDTLQFARFLALLPGDGRVVLRCQRELLRLFPGAVPMDAPPPAFDCQVALMSLPHRLGLAADTLAGRVPYLAAGPPPALPPGPRIGLVWAGSPGNVLDRQRSMPFAALAALLDLPAAFVSLQVPGPPPDPRLHAPALSDMADTAAVVAALDAVVTVDTAVAHLAGALGRPVMVLLPFAPDWRWRGPAWYPTAATFRQPRPGDWAGAVAALRPRLAALLAAAQRP